MKDPVKTVILAAAVLGGCFDAHDPGAGADPRRWETGTDVASWARSSNADPADPASSPLDCAVAAVTWQPVSASSTYVMARSVAANGGHIAVTWMEGLENTADATSYVAFFDQHGAPLAEPAALASWGDVFAFGDMFIVGTVGALELRSIDGAVLGQRAIAGAAGGWTQVSDNPADGLAGYASDGGTMRILFARPSATEASGIELEVSVIPFDGVASTVGFGPERLLEFSAAGLSGVPRVVERRAGIDPSTAEWQDAPASVSSVRWSAAQSEWLLFGAHQEFGAATFTPTAYRWRDGHVDSELRFASSTDNGVDGQLAFGAASAGFAYIDTSPFAGPLTARFNRAAVAADAVREVSPFGQTRAHPSIAWDSAGGRYVVLFGVDATADHWELTLGLRCDITP